MATPTKKVIVRHLEILALSVVLTACASGGQSTESVISTRPQPSTQSTQSTQSTSFASLPTSAELNESPNVKNSGAEAAFKEGFTGKNVKVGVLDSGVSSAVVSNLGLGLLTPQLYNAKEEKTTEYEDLLGHGSMVSSILSQAIDGKNGVGVAPNATLYMVNTLADNHKAFSLKAVSKGMDYLIENKIKVTNMSFACGANDAANDGCPTSAKAILDKASAAKMIVVIAAGNDSSPNPQYPGRFAKEAEAQGQFLVVGSVNDNNIISNFSSRAGDTKDFYMVALDSVVTRYLATSSNI
ncbi:MAG: S8 family serine peptidase [Neisseriaceae bacterium]|nr:S8 family serine peptidase [Neisseriaceae bacterium]